MAQPIPVEERRLAVVWTGTNGPDVAAALNALLPTAEFEVTEETSDHITLTGNIGYGHEPFRVDVGGAFLVNGAYWGGYLDAALYAAMFRPA